MRSGYILAAALIVMASNHLLSAQATKSQWDGVYTPAQATRGQGQYQEKCAYCHGRNLAGFVDPDVPAPSLVGDSFAASWNDKTLDELYEKIHMTMPLDQPGSLTPEQSADIVAFVLSYGKYPPGPADLPSKVDDLKAIKFLAQQ